ncbi:hypothetical protein L596_029932 [Steinernema carpocapsae]|uniref:Uncharacterized protein n=1 Tax=Steinernema carpocapsae TaxID=34508 RepID=A0A4U5LR83_STECR|nr:hypothetical protein L596_029932 [Steinernema carpocapsae]
MSNFFAWYRTTIGTTNSPVSVTKLQTRHWAFLIFSSFYLKDKNMYRFTKVLCRKRYSSIMTILKLVVI